MKVDDRVYSVRGRRKGFLDSASLRPVGGPFSGRVVRFTGVCGLDDVNSDWYAECSIKEDCIPTCTAVIRKDSDGKLVRCLLKNLRPYNAKEFRKVRKEWER